MPKVKGAQWQLGAVGNAEWTGVRLADLLEKAGVKEGAIEVILEGADEGEVKEPPRPAGKMHYAHSIPLRKALDDVLLAYEMNGEPLSDTHGAPLRAIVPGWYGMVAVKWLSRVIVTDQPFQGFYQTIEYTVWERSHENLPVQVQLGPVPVKAQISRPEVGEVVPAGTKIWVQGTAWTSDSEVTKVEVSDDRGATWKEAALLGEAVRNAWQFWEFEWSTPNTSGRHVLMVKATDARGGEQPFERDPDRGTYKINHCLPIEVEVRRDAS
jgi:DMSO/TMAO reductase YedYZ molybdopterin-dependent catalytic subunit